MIDETIKLVSSFDESTLVKETIHALLNGKKYTQLLKYLSSCLLFLDATSVRDDYNQQKSFTQNKSIHEIIELLNHKNFVWYSLNAITDYVLYLSEKQSESDTKFSCSIAYDVNNTRCYVIEYETDSEYLSEYDKICTAIIQAYDDSYVKYRKYQNCIHIPVDIVRIEDYSKVNMMVAGLIEQDVVKSNGLNAPILSTQGEDSITI